MHGKVWASIGAVLALVLVGCSKTVVVTQSPPPVSSKPPPSSAAPSASSSLASPVPSATITTPPPNLPVSESNVAGVFRGSGFAKTSLKMTPKCASGPCNVFGQGKGLKVNFGESKGLYRGHVGFNSSCSKGGVSLTLHASYTFAFKPVAADYIDGVWRATKLLVLTIIDRPAGKKTQGNLVLTCPSVHSKDRGTSVLAG